MGSPSSSSCILGPSNAVCSWETLRLLWAFCFPCCLSHLPCMNSSCVSCQTLESLQCPLPPPKPEQALPPPGTSRTPSTRLVRCVSPCFGEQSCVCWDEGLHLMESLKPEEAPSVLPAPVELKGAQLRQSWTQDFSGVSGNRRFPASGLPSPGHGTFVGQLSIPQQPQVELPQ